MGFNVGRAWKSPKSTPLRVLHCQYAYASYRRQAVHSSPACILCILRSLILRLRCLLILWLISTCRSVCPESELLSCAGSKLVGRAYFIVFISNIIYAYNPGRGRVLRFCSSVCLKRRRAGESVDMCHPKIKPRSKAMLHIKTIYVNIEKKCSATLFIFLFHS